MSAQEAAQGATNALDLAERVVEAAASAIERLDAQVTTVEGALGELASSRTAVIEAERAIEPLTEQRAGAAKALESATRADWAAAAAHECHPGDDCPVCGRSLPDSWVAPKATDLNAARKLLAEADGTLEKATKTQRRVSEAYAQVVGRLR